MGLDMYLSNEIYIGAHYEHRNVIGKVEISIDGNPVEIDLKKISSIEERVGIWRKCNQIHKWFVDNVQNGKDDCEKYFVSYQQLDTLKKLCEKVLETKNAELLPPARGIFFGSTAIDEWYFGGLIDTIEIINSLKPDGDYYYQSSW